MEFIGSCIIKDGSIEPVDEQNPVGDDNEIYEVIRIQASAPLFISDHLERWRKSMTETGRVLPKWTDSFDNLISWLVACNSLPDCDIRVVASGNGCIQCGYVKTEFPTQQMYEEGVNVGLLNAQREKPSLKIFHAEMRSAAKRQQEESGVYESLLVNKDGFITEGSRSNVYFINECGDVCTASDEYVLGGIMRKHVINLCEQKGITLRYGLVKPEDVSKYDSAFLSSTPMRILPICGIGEKSFNVNNTILRILMGAMEQVVKEQIKR